MKKYLFKTQLLSLAAFCGIVLAFASCANEDVVQNTTGAESDNDKNLTAFFAGDEATTRTSLDYNSGNFYWEAGDYIYVKDDNGVLQKSSNAPTSKVASFKYMVPGKFTASSSYKVYYLGKNSDGSSVSISTEQTQTNPNNTEHFGDAGDYGTATAKKVTGQNQFAFELEHQVAYLVFQPYTRNTVLHDCYLTMIEVSSDNDIAETYTVNPTTGALVASAETGVNGIVLTTQDSISGSSYYNGFPLTNSTASTATNGAYMVIKPGTHTLKVRYWVKDIVTNVEGTITKTLSSATYKPNTYYDMTANLNVKNYDGDHYYMWDAQNQYWYGYEWTKNLASGVGQPTLYDQPAGNYAKSNTDPNNRWYNEDGGSGRFDATQSCASLPNANEMSWYCMYGDSRWDDDELWTTMGHLYKGGMWFKKKSVLQAEHHYDTEKSADGSTDLRTTNSQYHYSSNRIINSGLPSAAEAGNYFYLPALGYYQNGQQFGVGTLGYFWSSSADSRDNSGAYGLLFSSYNSNVSVFVVRSNYGFRAGGFE